MLPFRVSEFAVGVIAVWAVDRRTGNQNILEAATLIGLAIILISVFTFDESMRFPGVTALLPCIGTALVIYGSVARKSGILFRNSLTVHLGLISYSLYLVHWPIIVLYNYYNFAEPELWEKVAIVAVSLLLAEMMYRFVETPFRVKRNEPTRLSAPAFGLAAALASVIVLFPAANVWAMKGWPWRFNISTDTVDPAIEEKVTASVNAVARRKQGGEIVILGDSIAGDLYESLLLTQSVGEATKMRVTRRTRGGCRPVLGPSVSSAPDSARGKQCERFFDASYKAIVASNPDVIFMYSRWGGVPEKIPEVKQRLEQSVALLLDKTKAHIVFLDYPPDYNKSVLEGAHLLYRLNASAFNERLEELRNIPESIEFDQFLSSLAQTNERLHALNQKSILCP